MDLIESQPGRDAPGKSAQPKLPPPPPKSPLPPPQPLVPYKPDLANLKRKRDSRNWEILSYSGRRDPESCKVAKDYPNLTKKGKEGG